MKYVLILLSFLSPIPSPIIKDTSAFVEVNHFYVYSEVDRVYKKKFIQVIWWEWKDFVSVPEKDSLGRETGFLKKTSGFVVKDYRIIWSSSSRPEQIMNITPRRYNNKWVCLFYDKGEGVLREVTSGWTRETHTSYDIEIENRRILSIENRNRLK